MSGGLVVVKPHGAWIQGYIDIVSSKNISYSITWRFYINVIFYLIFGIMIEDHRPYSTSGSGRGLYQA